jgi:chlorite dismutase
MNERLFSFIGGEVGQWRVLRMTPVIGLPLESVTRVEVQSEDAAVPATALATPLWTLRGMTSYERYVNDAEHHLLVERQPPLGRTEAVCAALIPVKKSPAWWSLQIDERRAIMEERSHHIGIGLEYLPAIARRLHHCRDLGEPFDFLTWFEYAPEHRNAFEELVGRLRETEEWTYIERECDIRLERA